MSAQSSIYKICAMMGNHRTFLLGRSSVGYQQVASVSKLRTLEAKLGLPPRPKRPLVPFFRFMAQIRPALVKSNPNARANELPKMAVVEWDKAPAGTKKDLEVAYQRDLEQWNKAMEKYKLNLSEENKLRLREAQEDLVEKREKLKMKQKMRELGKPKRPLSACLLFSNEKLQSRGNVPITDFRKQTTDMWNAMSDKEKDSYIKRADNLLQEYKKALVKWEERMVRLGNIDVVRSDSIRSSTPAAAPKKPKA